MAPLQCQGLAFPVSSGLKNIDIAFSSELMEPKNAQNNYTEKLIKLPNTSHCYDKPNNIIEKEPSSKAHGSNHKIAQLGLTPPIVNQLGEDKNKIGTENNPNKYNFFL